MTWTHLPVVAGIYTPHDKRTIPNELRLLFDGFSVAARPVKVSEDIGQVDQALEAGLKRDVVGGWR